MAVTRSTDGGQSWHKIEKIAPIRTAPSPIPTPRVRPAWTRPSGRTITCPTSQSTTSRVTSTSYGQTGSEQTSTMSSSRSRPTAAGGWTQPKAIDQTPGPHAFNQTVQVAGDGTLAVLYYDFRNNTPAPGLPTDVWLTQSTDGGNTWSEQHVTGPFDMKLAPNARGFFLGDYMGLEAIGDDLLAFFATTQGDSANVYSVRANR